MAELLDVFDEHANRTGRIVKRGQRLGPGEFRLVVHVWIRNECGEYLIQKRSERVQAGAGIWTPTLGHVHSGEDSLSAALRETEEEVGLKLRSSDLRQIDRHTVDDFIVDVYLAKVQMECVGSPILGPEVSATQWTSRDQIKKMMEQGDFFPYRYIETLIPR